MALATMSSKGQIVIPAELRRQADLNAGDHVVVDFDEAAGELRLRKAASVAERVDQLAAMVASRIKPDTPPLEDPRAFYRTREPRN